MSGAANISLRFIHRKPREHFHGERLGDDAPGVFARGENADVEDGGDLLPTFALVKEFQDPCFFGR